MAQELLRQGEEQGVGCGPLNWAALPAQSQGEGSMHAELPISMELQAIKNLKQIAR